MLLEDRVVLITGAASGIGKATVMACLRAGAQAVVAVDQNTQGLQQLLLSQEVDDMHVDEYDSSSSPGSQQAATQSKKRILTLSVDVSNQTQVQQMIQRVVSEFGRLDAAFNNAGVEGKRAAIAESTLDNYDHVMNTNARGVYLCMKYEIEQFVKQQSMKESSSHHDVDDDDDDDKTPRQQQQQQHPFAIVNCSSTAGLHGMPEFSAYCASKHAILGLTKSGALEYAKSNIRINALCPNTIDTAMVGRFQEAWPAWQAQQNASIPMGRMGTPEEMANAVVWMLSNQCTFLTGHCLCVDGAGTS